MDQLAAEVDDLAAQHGFAGVVRVDHGDGDGFARAYGFADRANKRANTVDTRFAIASGGKGLTALTVAALIEDGVLDLTTPARSLLAGDLPLIDDEVTVEHLLGHRSGIGDYVDEEAGHAITDHVLPVPVHELATTEQYLAVLGGHDQLFPPGERFRYCNGGYVVLALLAERAAGAPFHRLVHERVCLPAGMTDTAFLRTDELPGRTALGYLPIEGTSRTNVFHLPVLGSGDGGIYSTVADVRSLWTALFAGRVVAAATLAELTRPRSDVPAESSRYGLGFWLHRTGPQVKLVGYDAGVSFHSVHDPRSGRTHTVVANSSDGAWPVARLLDDHLIER